MMAGPTATERDRERIDAQAIDMRERFNRLPFGFEHNVHQSDVLRFDSLRELAAKYIDADHFVASGGAGPGTPFYAVRHGALSPLAALDDLENGRHRILLKRPENYDLRFRALLDTLFADVVAQRGGLGSERVVRLESSVLISSAAAITPFHFDPEISFFFQIEGEKIYHLLPPAALREPELERFYKMGIVDIGQVDFLSYDRSGEYAFPLVPGLGLHQPQNSPHWVETRASRTVSYVFSFETDVMRAVGRTRSFNHYMRGAGLRPAVPGTHPLADAVKAGVMEVAIPLRRRAGTALRSAFGR
jgi:hypothetical protein